MDKLPVNRRSENMRRIRSKDTSPELILRRLLHKMGYRFRVHREDLPGKPDIVFPSRRKVIFVHGCFWHQHGNCAEGRIPASNQDYWGPKLQRNVERDKLHQLRLNHAGWQVLVVWECELRNAETVAAEAKRFLEGRG